MHLLLSHWIINCWPFPSDRDGATRTLARNVKYSILTSQIKIFTYCTHYDSNSYLPLPVNWPNDKLCIWLFYGAWSLLLIGYAVTIVETNNQSLVTTKQAKRYDAKFTNKSENSYIHNTCDWIYENRPYRHKKWNPIYCWLLNLHSCTT